MSNNSVKIDKDTEEFLSMITELKNTDEKKFIETRGVLKGIVLENTYRKNETIGKE